MEQSGTPSAQEMRQQAAEKGKEAANAARGRARDQVEKVGGYLHDSDADTILRDVEDFGRKQPLAVAAGGFVIGLLASRFLKASSAERYRTAKTTPGQMMPGYTDGGRSVYGNGGQLAGSEGTGEGVGAGKGTRPTGLPAHQ